MGRRANPTVIGAFIIGAVALIVIGLLVLGRGHFFSDTQTFVLYFDGSVKGLNIGAPVEFQGVRIGSVTDIHVSIVSKTNEYRTPVYIQLELNRIREARHPAESGRAEGIPSVSDSTWFESSAWWPRVWSPAN